MIHFSKIEEDEAFSSSKESITLLAGTRIKTPVGEICIEDLRVGDLVQTENGALPIKIICKRSISPSQITKDNHLYPSRLAKGAIGFGFPTRDLFAHASQHVLFRHFRIPLLFGEDAVMIELGAISRADKSEVRGSFDYYHLGFDREEIIFAEGIPIKSFSPTVTTLMQSTDEERNALLKLYPALKLGHQIEDCGYAKLQNWELAAALS